MNWDWAQDQLKAGKHVVRASERRREIEDLDGNHVRWMGREGIQLQHGFSADMQPASIIIGSMSRAPMECNSDDLAATDWAIE